MLEPCVEHFRDTTLRCDPLLDLVSSVDRFRAGRAVSASRASPPARAGGGAQLAQPDEVRAAAVRRAKDQALDRDDPVRHRVEHGPVVRDQQDGTGNSSSAASSASRLSRSRWFSGLVEDEEGARPTRRRGRVQVAGARPRRGAGALTSRASSQAREEEAAEQVMGLMASSSSHPAGEPGQAEPAQACT